MGQGERRGCKGEGRLGDCKGEGLPGECKEGGDSESELRDLRPGEGKCECRREGRTQGRRRPREWREPCPMSCSFQELERRLETQELRAKGRLGAANVQGNARSWRGVREAPGWWEHPRAAGEKEDPEGSKRVVRPGSWNQLHHPLLLFSAPTPHCRSFGDVLPLNQATVLPERAAGWQQSQVDVFVS